MYFLFFRPSNLDSAYLGEETGLSKSGFDDEDDEMFEHQPEGLDIQGKDEKLLLSLVNKLRSRWRSVLNRHRKGALRNMRRESHLDQVRQ